METCSTKVIHHELVEKVADSMPEPKLLIELAEFFKLFGDSTRISILYALLQNELCVCDICALLGMQQSAVSHQLRILRQARIVRNRREGRVVYYSLDDDHIARVLEVGMTHVREDKPSSSA